MVPSSAQRLQGVVHPKREMIDEAAQHGFAPANEQRGRIWDVILFERPAPPAGG